jgi:hypothetical protein
MVEGMMYGGGDDVWWMGRDDGEMYLLYIV